MRLSRRACPPPRARLISDPDLRLAPALGLPTFSAGGRTFYERLALIAVQGHVYKVFHPVGEPERNAAEVADWLEREHQRDGD